MSYNDNKTVYMKQSGQLTFCFGVFGISPPRAEFGVRVKFVVNFS